MQNLLGEKLAKDIVVRLAENEIEPNFLFFAEDDEEKDLNFKTVMVIIGNKVMIKMQPDVKILLSNRAEAYALANKYNMQFLSKTVIVEMNIDHEDFLNPIFEVSTGINQTFTTEEEIVANLSNNVDFLIDLYNENLKNPVFSFIDNFVKLTIEK